MAENILKLVEHRADGTPERIQSATFPRQVRSVPLARRFVTEVIGPHAAAKDAVLLLVNSSRTPWFTPATRRPSR
jgi:hypothetical protein